MSPEALVGVCIFALATGGWIMHLQAALNDARRDLDELFETRATRVELELVVEELFEAKRNGGARS